MKRFTKLFVGAVTLTLLSSCEMFNNLIPGKNYSGYEEFLEKELNLKKAKDIDEVNKGIKEKAYAWDSNSSSKYDAYYSADNSMILIYKNETKISYVTIDGNSLLIQKNEEKGYVATFNSYTAIGIDGTRWDIFDSEKSEDNLNDEIKEAIKVNKDDNGYLFVIENKNMLYVPLDLSTIYTNDFNTNEFQGVNSKLTIPSSDLLTNTLNLLGERETVKLFPQNSGEYEIWHGVSEYKGSYSHYSAMILGIKAQDYAEILKNNGYEITRAAEDEPFYAFYGKDGGFWLCTDKNKEQKVILKNYGDIYTDLKGKSYGKGPNTEVWIYKAKTGYSEGRNLTTNEDWSDHDKEIMNGWYDGKLNVVIPFIKLQASYNVSSLTSKAVPDILSGAMNYEQECYKIYDNSLTYHLKGYDEILEAAGYKHYVPSYNLDNSDEFREYSQSEERKYYDCYINKELNCAIKYSFDINNGNTIKVFKFDEIMPPFSE